MGRQLVPFALIRLIAFSLYNLAMMMLTHEQLSQYALGVGLDLVGVAPAGPAGTWEAYRDWLAQGYAGGLARYLARPDALARRADPRRILPEARSVIVVAASYAGAPLPPLPPLHGRVSRYAWGEDYHRWLLRRLKMLLQRLAVDKGAFPARAYVDTGPILERDWAREAGLGWLGKHTNLIHPRWGSYLFLGVALVGLDCEPTSRPELPACGSCTRCLDACPSGALMAPGRLDARRCVAYLTIEHRGSIPVELRPALGENLCGCDICQEVCPWNHKPLLAHQGERAPAAATLYLPELLLMKAEEFRARFRQTAIWRATPEGLARNAAVVLGNRGDPAAIPYLEQVVSSPRSDLLREHAAWAIQRIKSNA
ncbi:MAG: tRNA epoxyqueuosine(34) reductase QueG [Chloroflexota bacterium]|nr:tRNA epoxyqueuosine(34) reductase QueG [Chloroflexota bacterium]